MSTQPASLFIELKRHSADHIDHLVAIWNEACGADLALSAASVTYNLQPAAGIEQTGWLAVEGGEPAGFVLAGTATDTSAASPSQTGWIAALAVRPAWQRRGLGGSLMQQAERWLAGCGNAHAQIGGGLRPFVAALPVELESEPFFHDLGYQKRADDIVWDVAANLATYVSSAPQVDGAVRPALPGQEALLLAYLAREFPGRWHEKCRNFLAEGGRISDYMVLWTQRGFDGFCQLTFEDSARPIERCYPYRLPRPWGHLGPIGVSADIRGQGFGAAVLDAGLRRLHNTGVNGCVIDWTDLLDFYAKFGFAPYRQYQPLVKAL